MKKIGLWSCLAVIGVSSTVFGSNYQLIDPSDRYKCEPQWFLRGDFLYWKLSRSRQSISVNRELELAPFGFLPTTFRSRDSTQDCGFRIGLGARPSSSEAVLSLLWTHYKTSHIDNNLDQNGDEDTTTTFTVGVPTTKLGNDDFTSLVFENHNKFQLDTIDLRIQQWVNPCRRLSANPYAGVKLFWLSRSFDSLIEDNLQSQEFVGATVNVTQLLLRSELDLKNKYRGAGLTLGSDFNLEVGCGLSLYANAAMSLLIGQVDVKVRGKTADDTDESTQDLFNTPLTQSVDREQFASALHQRFYRLGANVEGSAGLQWSYEFPCSRQVFLARAGYDFSYWYLKSRITTNNLLIANDSFWLQGFSVSAQLAF